MNCLNDDKICKDYIDSLDGYFDENRYNKLTKIEKKFEYLIRKKIYDLNGKFIKFNPVHYCDKNCKGWNGMNLRCDCTCNHIEWDYIVRNKHMYIYLEVY